MILVDTNVLLDIATNDAKWAEWSLRHLDAARPRLDQCRDLRRVLDRLRAN